MQTGSESTGLIIIRGNSASGKTSVAHEIRKSFGHGIAIVSQDVIRRDILRQADDPGNPAIGLMDLTVRFALDHGYHVILEGILFSKTHREMLTRLVRDHAGTSACFYYDLSFEETVGRHASKPQSGEYGPEVMRNWYRERDLIPALHETILGPGVTLDGAVSMIMTAAGISGSNESASSHPN